ncbi:Wzz/FepE/Etk N-terminal domain-containing protein, partial [bacterium]
MQKNAVKWTDYLIVLFKWKKFIVVNCFVVGILAAALSLMIPKWYRSKTTILPPSGDSQDVNLSSLLTDMPFASFGFEGSSASTNLYIAILKSRTVMEAIVKKYNLMERYKKKTLEETVKAL